MKRKIKDSLADEENETAFYFSSSEDIIISKLKWYELGNKVSERQWFDVVGVIKVQGDSLDKEYLQTWAKKLGLWGLLRNAFEDAGIRL
ncbi:MAG: hypothetical protein DWQ05_11560 [Calditrichaeota bacterium]|nr:MAG: hypothetical protein DWQ05_11560 [Calditrichota bacterium]